MIFISKACRLYHNGEFENKKSLNIQAFVSFVPGVRLELTTSGL